MVKVNPNDHMYHYRAVHQQMITGKMKQGGHSCKIGNMRCPGTLKNQNPQFEEKK